jgi:hypothetical protein
MHLQHKHLTPGTANAEISFFFNTFKGKYFSELGSPLIKLSLYQAINDGRQTALHYTVQYTQCTAMHSFALCSVYWWHGQNMAGPLGHYKASRTNYIGTATVTACTALHCTALLCTALHCSALHCTGYLAPPSAGTPGTIIRAKYGPVARPLVTGHIQSTSDKIQAKSRIHYTRRKALYTV